MMLPAASGRGVEYQKIFFDDDRDNLLTRLGEILSDTQTQGFIWQGMILSVAPGAISGEGASIAAVSNEER